jgi:acetylornithine deacetylase/succinyl-diaminopimelate desuccinylase-like protein
LSEAHEYANKNAERFKEQLKELLRIPSVSTLPEHQQDVRKTAEWLAEDLRQSGMHSVQLLETPGNPVVYGEWLEAGEDVPTVLVYGHYDVQPASIEDGWEHDPFDPQERDCKIYARGATDNKGQHFAHMKAVESLMFTNGRLPVNIKFMLEGEEEVSSTNLSNLIIAEKERFKANLCVISDGGMPSMNMPAITYGLRGIVAMEVTVHGPSADLHSGRYGGTVHNPLQALAEVIAALHNADGSVAVPGFYDDVIPLERAEREELAKHGITEARWHNDTGAPETWGEAAYTLEERIGARPTLEINGIAGGFSGPGFKTVLPAKAMAKISCRLVPNQQPERIYDLVCDYITRLTPPTVRVEFQSHGGSPAALVNLNAPAIQAAITAYEKGWGETPIFNRAGGSIPVVSDVQHTLGIPVILMSLGLHSDGAHGPNEHFHVDCFQKGIDTIIHFLEEVAHC